jgi:hypothetical protein
MNPEIFSIQLVLNTSANRVSKEKKKNPEGVL